MATHSIVLARGTTRISGSLSCGAREVRSPCAWRGGARHGSPVMGDKNTGVGCHFFLQCMKVKNESEIAQSCPTLRNPMDYSLPGFPVRRRGLGPWRRSMNLVSAGQERKVPSASCALPVAGARYMEAAEELTPGPGARALSPERHAPRCLRLADLRRELRALLFLAGPAVSRGPHRGLVPGAGVPGRTYPPLTPPNQCSLAPIQSLC